MADQPPLEFAVLAELGVLDELRQLGLESHLLDVCLHEAVYP